MLPEGSGIRPCQAREPGQHGYARADGQVVTAFAVSHGLSSALVVNHAFAVQRAAPTCPAPCDS